MSIDVTTATAEPVAAPAAAPVDHLRAELTRRDAAGELVPGAIDRLYNAWNPGMAHWSPERVAEETSRRLGGIARRFVNPEAPPDSGPVPALRRALARHATDLREGAFAELESKLAAEFAGRPEPKVAGAVARLLNGPAGQKYLANPGPPPAGLTRLETVISETFGADLADGAAAALAGDLFKRERHLGGAAAHDVVRRVATLLANPTVAMQYTRTGAPIKESDGRLRQAPMDRPAAERRPVNILG